MRSRARGEKSQEGRWRKATWLLAGKDAEGPRSAPPHRLWSSDQGSSAATAAMGLCLRAEQMWATKESGGHFDWTGSREGRGSSEQSLQNTRIRLGGKAKPKSGTPAGLGAYEERRALKGRDVRRPRETVDVCWRGSPRQRQEAWPWSGALQTKPMRAERPSHR